MERRPPPPTVLWAFAATLALAHLLAAFPAFAVSALAPTITADLDLSRAGYGSLVTVMVVTSMLCYVLAGRLVDRGGGRRWLAALFAASAVSCLALGSARSYLWLASGMAFGGLAMAFANPAGNRLVLRHVPRPRQGLVVGVKHAGGQVGAVVAGVALPAGALVLGWRGVLLACVLGPLAGLALTARFVPASRPEDRHGDRARARTGAAAGIAGLLGLYGFLSSAGNAIVVTYLPLYAFERVGMGATSAGLMLSLVGLLGIAARLTLGWVADRLESTTLPLLVLAMGGSASLGLLLLAERLGPWALVAGAVGYGATGGQWLVVAMLAIVRTVTPGRTGRVSGYVMTSSSVGFMAAPVVFGRSVDVTGSWTPGWAGVVVLSLLSLLLVTWWHRRDADAGRRALAATRAEAEETP